ncbi:hypothetical protein [Butyrivibrio sp. AD3002]|uniref:hypothetical protein n=1 Tax=Butyrivibrio sp. AD3002 TaxID=1280670 RepID=UPI0012DCD154|nr:hypothetical protein [Butyrivibrio sp. AD3002]
MDTKLISANTNVEEILVKVLFPISSALPPVVSMMLERNQNRIIKRLMALLEQYSLRSNVFPVTEENSCDTSSAPIYAASITDENKLEKIAK